MDGFLQKLLNAIHDDGGQHTFKVGIERSVDEAIEKFRTLDGHSKALAIARNDLAALRVRIRELEEELNDNHGTLVRNGDILRATANALHGGPLAIGFWSHHDLPELAKKLWDEHHAATIKRINASQGAAED